MKPLCIAHGGDLSEPSGGTDRIVAFASGLQRRGFDVTLVTPRPIGEFPEELNGLRTVTVPIQARGILDQPIRAMLVSQRAQRIAEREGAHLQIEHSSHAGIASLTGCHNYIVDMHDLVYPSPQYSTLPFSRLAQKTLYSLERRGVTQSSHVIVVSEPMKRLIIDEWNVPEQKIAVIPNGYSPDKLEQFADHEEVEGRVGFLGTLHQKLDLQAFVDISRLPSVERVVVIGDGEARKELDRMVSEAGADNVDVLGRLPGHEAFELLATSQVVIYPLKPSLHTKMLTSRKIFDYAALRKPMVLGDVSDSEIWARFKRCNAAVFADPEDRGMFAKQVESLLEDERRRKAFGRAASELVSDYVWDNHVDALFEIYQKYDDEEN